MGLFNTTAPTLSPDSKRALAHTLLEAANIQEDLQEQVDAAVAQIHSGTATLRKLGIVK